MPDKKFRVPKIGEIRAKNADYLSANEIQLIRKLSHGLDPFQLPDDSSPADVLALCGWFSITLRGEFAGISVDEVRDWPLAVFNFDPPDDDADDVRAAAADLADESSGGADDEPPFTGPSGPE